MANNNDKRSRAPKRSETLARLAWWACLGLGAISSFGLHAMGERPYAIVVDPGGIGTALADYLVGGVMESLQYVVPALCVSALLVHLARLPAGAGTSGGAPGGLGLSHGADNHARVASARPRRALHRPRVGAGS